MRHATSRSAVAVYSCLVILLASAFGPWTSVRAADPVAPKPLEWRVLLLVKAKGDIQVKGFPDVKYEMSGADIGAVKEAFAAYTPAFVKTLSRGRLVWKPEVVISPAPLTKVAKLGNGNWVGPECVEEDLDKLAPPGSTAAAPRRGEGANHLRRSGQARAAPALPRLRLAAGARGPTLVHRRGRLVVQGLVRPLVVVEPKVSPQPFV